MKTYCADHYEYECQGYDEHRLARLEDIGLFESILPRCVSRRSRVVRVLNWRIRVLVDHCCDVEVRSLEDAGQWSSRYGLCMYMRRAGVCTTALEITYGAWKVLVLNGTIKEASTGPLGLRS